MRSGFLPIRDLDLLEWSGMQVTRLSDDPEAYGITAEQLAVYSAAQAAFAQAMKGVARPIRSQSSVIVKEEARLALEQAARKLNVQIRGAGDAASEKLALLGLTIRKSTYRRIGRPEMQPVMRVVRVDEPAMKLIISAPGTSRIALPEDVASVAVARWIGPQPAIAFEEWPIAAQASRARITLTIDASPGTPVHFVARYLNRRGESGPWSAVTSTHALGGIVLSRSLAA